MAQLPVVDFSRYTEGTAAERAETCRQLVAGFRRWGFVKLINYGIPNSHIDALFKWSRQFFALQHEQKMVAAHPPQPNPHRGYSYVGQEVTSDLSRPRERAERSVSRIFDIKESFDQGAAHDCLYTNVWPEEAALPGFRAFMEDHFARCHSMHLSVLAALAEGLSIPVDHFPAAHKRNESELRLLHYPSVAAAILGGSNGTGRISEHTDAGSATILWQDGVGGLEIEDVEAREFVPVECSAPAVLVNLGDAMERWTNTELPSVYHRVRKPPAQDPAANVPERYSIAYFGKPDRDADLAPLPRFVTADRPAKYPSITGGELNQNTLLRTYEPEIFLPPVALPGLVTAV